MPQNITPLSVDEPRTLNAVGDDADARVADGLEQVAVGHQAQPLFPGSWRGVKWVRTSQPGAS